MPTNVDTNINTYSTKKAATLGAQRALAKLGVEQPMLNVHFTVEETFDMPADPTRWLWRQIDVWYTGRVLPVGETITPHDARLQRAAADAIAETEAKQKLVETPGCAAGTSAVHVGSSSRSRPMTDTSTATGNTKHREGSVVQNGVRRPSDPDGKCGVIWTYLDKIAAKGETPTLAALKEYGGKLGWKDGNMAPEFYNWRRFNGVPSSRKAKAKKAA
jgi:hypothetical protein